MVENVIDWLVKFAYIPVEFCFIICHNKGVFYQLTWEAFVRAVLEDAYNSNKVDDESINERKTQLCNNFGITNEDLDTYKEVFNGETCCLCEEEEEVVKEEEGEGRVKRRWVTWEKEKHYLDHHINKCVSSTNEEELLVLEKQIENLEKEHVPFELFLFLSLPLTI